MPIQIHNDVDDMLSFPHTPRHEDCPLPVEGPEKSLAALRNCVLPGTGDAGWMSGGVRDSQTQAVASQPVSWHELLETYPSFYSGHSSPASSRPPSPTPLQPEPASQPSSGRHPSSDPLVKLVMAKKRRSLQSILIPPFFHPALTASSSKPSSPTSTHPPSPAQSQGRFRSHSAAASTSHFVLPPAIPISPTSDTHDAPRNSPPSDLLSDDPFADLSPTPSTFILPSPTRVSRPLSPVLTLGDLAPLTGSGSTFQTPRSPLAQSFTEACSEENEEAEEADTVSEIISPWSSPPRTPPTTPLPSSDTPHVLRRPKSSQIRPAYTRPAFTPRPSLPSLYTLAQRSIPIPRVKRGRVGAKLPVEPWALEDWECVDANNSPESSEGSDSRRASQITIKDLRVPQSPEPISHSSDYDQEPAPTTDEARDSYFDLQFSESSVFEDDRRTIRGFALTRSQSDPSPSCSSTTSPLSHACDSDSSSEASLPSTQPSDAYLAAAYSRGAAVSVYGDLRSELDYDYLHAISRLDRTPSPEPYPIHSRPRTPDCDGEAGTAAQTVYNLDPLPTMSHQRTISNTSIWTFNMADPASPSASKSTFGPSEQPETPASVESSDYDEDVEYFSFPSSSDRDSAYMSAPASRIVSFAGASSFRAGFHAYDEHEDEDVRGSGSEESSAPDITARLSHLSPSDLSTRATCYYSAEELTDAGDSGHRTGRSSHGGNGGSYSQTNGGWQGGSSASYGRSYGGGMRNGSGSGGRDDDDGKRPRGRPGLPTASYMDTSESESEESSDEEEDEHPRRGRPSLSKSAAPVDDAASTDDDVPLAQRLPSALQAQKSIRRQVRAEHEQRKRARSVRRPGTADGAAEAAPPLPFGHSASASISTRPRKPSTPDPPAPPPAPAPSQPLPRARARTNTLPSKPTSPFSVGELTKKLLDVQASAPPLPSPRSHAARLPAQELAKESASDPAQVALRAQAEHHQASVKPSAPDGAVTRLRSMRSFHRPNTATEPEMVPAVPGGGARLGRSATTATRRRPAMDELPASPQLTNTVPAAALERKRSTRSHSRRPSTDQEPAMPPVPSPLPPREEGGADLQRKRSARSQSRRPSVDRTRPSIDSARPPVPAFPNSSASAPSKTQTAWHQRIFIGSLQRFSQVEMTSFYTARDVLELLQNQGHLDNGSATGWMLWEVCQDFGMERPIRSFEVVAEVCGSWLADKTVNMLMAKKTPLASKLSRAAIPSSSPICSGWVQHEYKKGKWQKRWMELREHSLWLSKRDTGKDQVSLCSMNNFDAYVVIRPNKAPKGFVFAVKSTDNITFFESTFDYVHTFSVPEREGENWLEKILLARSYIIHQERNVIMGGSSAGGVGASLSRAGTRKRPAQPLVDFGRQVVTEPPPLTTAVFEPGSLLAKRAH